jgi:diadenosine tetraphosphate (Ap4A) HIT family hydrolase
MCTQQDDLTDKLSQLSLKMQLGIGCKSGLNPAWLVPYSFKCGYSFPCQLTFKQLIQRQLCQKYFQELLFITEQNNKIYDFHMRLRSQGNYGLTVDFICNNADDQVGPVKSDVCITCDMNNQLSQLSLIKQNPTTCIWLDAQVRNNLIVTPRRHIERLSEMTEEEMVQFWSDAYVVLEEEGCEWQSMVLNHGKYRKHFHLRMKITIEQNQWNQFIKKKYGEKIQQMRHLLERNEPDVTQTYSGIRRVSHWSELKNVKTKEKNEST